jgi:propanediol dehydratase large subunit
MYLQTWNKYLPVIRILLKRSIAGPQQMSLSRIDFETGGSRTRKLTCSFNIQLERGRLVTLSQSVTVKNLLEVLQQDDAVAQLMRHNMYEINLTSSFQLTITNITPVLEAEPEAMLADTDEADVVALAEADTITVE